MTADQSRYDANFGTKKTFKSDSNKLEAAFKQASDIRKFEIDLYWRRAGYFWALIAVAFAGYFSILSSRFIPNRFFLSFVVGSIGFVFTFAWYLANRGSKYWQENWENHLDLLEDEITGPLYKTRLERPPETDWAEKLVTGPRGVSVSKINQWVSVFVLCIWLLLCAYSLAHSWFRPITAPGKGLVSISYFLVAAMAALFCFLMYGRKGKTHQDDHHPIMRVRATKVGGQPGADKLVE